MGGLDRMKQRMVYVYGETDDDRNVREKYLSFKSAIEDPYQSERITYKDRNCRCLINPDKLKEQYDKKEISIDNSEGMKEGDVFYWNRTDTYWLVYLHEHTEEAYFRASILRCNYDIDIEGIKYWIYLRGPVETALIWRQKHQTEFNDLNYSILFYITKNEQTLKFFDRFQIVKFDGHNWRVAATDKYSQEGVIEVYIEEYYDNEMEDAMIEPEIIVPEKKEPFIEGPQIVKAFDTGLSYSVVNTNPTGEFVVNSSKVKITDMKNGSCFIDILTGKSAKIELIYRTEGELDLVLPITIQSL